MAAARVGKADDELSPKEAAELIGVGLTTVYEYIDCGDLPARDRAPKSRRRRSLLILRSDVAALLDRQRARAARRRR